MQTRLQTNTVKPSGRQLISFFIKRVSTSTMLVAQMKLDP
jgi:hypothetical protein